MSLNETRRKCQSFQFRYTSDLEIVKVRYKCLNVKRKYQLNDEKSQKMLESVNAVKIS